MNSDPSRKPVLPILAALLIWLAVGLPQAYPVRPAAAQEPDHGQINVVLDAGHGGIDHGANGPTGLIEKTVNLELVRKLTLGLERRFQVTLTRSDDYQLPLRQRAAIANQGKGDLFVSLHTGAAFLHAVRGVTIYYHSPQGDTGSPAPAHQDSADMPRLWREIQTRHIAASRRLAEALKEALLKSGIASECRILAVPLPLLEGADMPAVLVEVGPITNPAAESAMLSPSGLDLLAGAISQGIAGFLDQPASRANPQ